MLATLVVAGFEGALASNVARDQHRAVLALATRSAGQRSRLWQWTPGNHCAGSAYAAHLFRDGPGDRHLISPNENVKATQGQILQRCARPSPTRNRHNVEIHRAARLFALVRWNDGLGLNMACRCGSRENERHHRKQPEHCQIDDTGDRIMVGNILAKRSILEDNGKPDFGSDQQA